MHNHWEVATKTPVKVIFPANPPDQPPWPHIGYDVEARSQQVIGVLRERLPEFEFLPAVFYSPEEAERAAQAEQGSYDGYLVYLTALWSGIGALYARKLTLYGPQKDGRGDLRGGQDHDPLRI